MTKHTENLIVGQGIAGTTVAWELTRRQQSFVIIDRDDSVTASKVAAGLVTPVTGKRHTIPPGFSEDWQSATQLYKFAEQQTGVTFFDQSAMMLLFPDRTSQESFVASVDSTARVETERWKGRLHDTSVEQYGVKISPAGRLKVAAYLNASRDFFRAKDSHTTAGISSLDEIDFDTTCIRLRSLNLTADRIIFCVGAAGFTPLFPGVPNNPARGDILTVQIPGYQTSEVVHRGMWIAPNDDSTYSVGATYDWKNLRPIPSAEGREEILHRLRRILPDVSVDVVAHQAAVRPTMKDYLPIVGQHPEYDRAFVFNGLGSKGSLRAPVMAEHLLNLIEHKTPVPTEFSVQRLMKRTPDGRPKPLTVLAQEKIRSSLQSGDTAIDGTVGNGFDTAFLANVVGTNGQVIGYDVQQQAIDSTRRRLAAGGLSNVDLRMQCHSSIADLPKQSATAAMFNLGYLPRGDHGLITQPKTSVKAIESAVRVLKPGGILTVLSYRGHDGGPEEFDAVERLLQQFASRYHLETIESTPPKANAPVLFVLKKTDA